MKMIAIVVSGEKFHCAHVRSPDLFRREIAAIHGSAHLVLAIAPVCGTEVPHLIGFIADEVLPRFVPSVRLQRDPVFLASLHWLIVGKPLISLCFARVIRKLRHGSGVPALRRWWYRCAGRTSGGAA